MATGKPSSPGSFVGQASRLPIGRVVTDMQARRPHHKASGPAVWCTRDAYTTKLPGCPCGAGVPPAERLGGKFNINTRRAE